MGVTYGKPAGLYILIEQLHAKSGMPSFGNTIGPSMQQIYRQVYQLHSLHDTFIDGQRVTPATATVWQQIKGALGINITTAPNGKHATKLEYAGFTNEIQPLPKMGDTLPQGLTRQYLFRTPSPYLFGTDPIPEVRLYRNPRSVFRQVNGGTSPSTAMARFNSTNGELVMLESASEIELALREFETKQTQNRRAS